MDNSLDRQFDVEQPDRVWVTDVTYIKTLQGFAYLAVVIGLFSRRIVDSFSVLQATPARRWVDVKPTNHGCRVERNAGGAMAEDAEKQGPIHSDQGAQFTSMVWASLLKAHNLEHSMSRYGNCHDNAAADSFFDLLKRESVRRKTYTPREDTRRDVFDYIKMFYNPKHKHVRNGMLSPAVFERQQKMKAQGVWKTRGYFYFLDGRNALKPIYAPIK